MDNNFDLVNYFSSPVSWRQKQYEAVRAIIMEKKSVEETARSYGYKSSTVYSLLRDAKAGKTELFPVVRKGPQGKRTSYEVQDKIIIYRRQGLSTPDIQSCLKADIPAILLWNIRYKRNIRASQKCVEKGLCADSKTEIQTCFCI